MTREEIDAMLVEAVRDADRDGAIGIRYHFAALVAVAEREACAKVCNDLVLAHPGRADLTAEQCAAAIRARGEKP